MVDVNKHQWGSEAIWANTKQYSARLFVIAEGYKTPYIYHKKRDKTIFVLQGMVQLTVEGKNRMLNAGEDYHIPPTVMHGIASIKGEAVILEAGTQIENDIVIVEE